MRKFLFSLLFAFIGVAAAAQNDFTLPENWKFDQKEDYAKYEEYIVPAINWFLDTPADRQDDKRQHTADFVLEWSMGCPYVHIVMYGDILTFAQSSRWGVLVFIMGYNKQALLFNKYTDKVNGTPVANEPREYILDGNVAGIEAVVDYYTRNRALMQKDENIEKYITLKKKGKLESYVESKIPKNIKK